MINTTTMPTQIDNPSFQFFPLLCILSTGIIIGISFIETFLYRLRKQGCKNETDSSDEEEEEDSYCDNYRDEFEALSMRELTPAELLDLNTKIVREQVAEKVEVILTYDKATETFWYYTDQLKEVSYDILETVARKFALDYDCKMICLQPTQQVSGEQSSGEQASADIEKQPTEPSVFAKFKSYNTAGKGAASNFTSVLKVVEQMNHFRYRGKIVDYEETQKKLEKQKNVEEPQLDYASYKKLLDEKKEN